MGLNLGSTQDLDAVRHRALPGAVGEHPVDVRVRIGTVA